MNFYVLSSILASVTLSAMAIFMFINGRSRLEIRIWTYICIGIIFWQVGSFGFSTATSKEMAFYWWQFAHIGAMSVPPIFFHFICMYLNIKRKWLIILAYIFSSIFILINFYFGRYFIGDLRLTPDNFYFVDWFHYRNPLFLLYYLTIYAILLGYSYFLLLRAFGHSHGIKRKQMQYLIIGTAVAWSGPAGIIISYFRINLYEYTNILMGLFPLIIGCAILKHQLLDINIIFKKGLIYSILVAIITAIYAILVLGVGHLFQGFVGYKSFLINAVVVFAIALMFNPIRDWIQHVLDRRLFHGTLESLEQDKQKLQTELFHAEKLAYVGQLASSVAHEIRNPITTIKTYLEFLPKKYDDPDFKEKLSRLIPSEITRVEKIVNQLLGLARQRKLVLRPINITQCIDSTLELLENHLAIKNINVKKDYESDAITINGDLDSLKQVFLNLFLNAVQAMDENGTLSVSTSYIARSTSQKNKNQIPKTNHVLSTNDYVQVVIKDTGCGMSQETLENLFTPFKTTKKDGIGLGLAITKEIIDQHGGTIKAESKIGSGTTFIITLNS